MLAETERPRTLSSVFGCYNLGILMKLTILNRLKICFEVLTTRSGHAHTAQEKQLSTFLRGYMAGLNDKRLEEL